jgi:hypothetical protein
MKRIGKMGIKKIKHRGKKFFGYPEDSWARLGGKNGKKRSYGHFSEYPDNRSKAEKQDKDFRELHEQEIKDFNTLDN